jgi:hypothetical protein
MAMSPRRVTLAAVVACAGLAAIGCATEVKAPKGERAFGMIHAACDIGVENDVAHTRCWKIDGHQFPKLAGSVPRPYGVREYGYELDVIVSRAHELGDSTRAPRWTGDLAQLVAEQVHSTDLLAPRALIWVYTTSTTMIPEIIGSDCGGYQGGCDPVPIRTGRMVPKVSHAVVFYYRGFGVKYFGYSDS